MVAVGVHMEDNYHRHIVVDMVYKGELDNLLVDLWEVEVILKRE